jgi:hypothetical protein
MKMAGASRPCRFQRSGIAFYRPMPQRLSKLPVGAVGWLDSRPASPAAGLLPSVAGGSGLAAAYCGAGFGSG